MNRHRRVAYVSNVMPGHAGGGAIIVQRHLEYLVQRRWEVSVLERSPSGSRSWRTVPAPVRCWWWPPLRPRLPGIAALSSLVWCRALRRSIGTRPDVIVTVVWGPLSWVAAELARAWNSPLVAIVHDHCAERPEDRDGRHAFEYACSRAATILAVSSEMQSRLEEEYGAKVALLYPVSAPRDGKFAQWQPRHAARPRVAHAGALLPFHAPYLERLASVLAEQGGELLVISPADNATLASLLPRCPNLVHHDYFTTNTEALRWIAREASAVTVMHTRGTDAAGRPPTGFPSRLVELAQLGLPMILAAPPVNPLARWAQSQGWLAATDPTDTSTLRRLVSDLKREPTWTAMAAQTSHAAENDFEPERLHARFEAVLVATLRSAAI